MVEPKNFNEASKDVNWLKSMNEELDQIEKNIIQTYWIEEMHTTVHVLNKSHLRPHSDKTPYELWYGRPASIKHFKVFGSKCYIKNNNENLGKYDDRADEGIF